MREQILDMAVRNWGFEDGNTIELFYMYEHGESYETMQNYYDSVNNTLAKNLSEDMED